jgi:beta-ureidopropionase / N-carbamoyl-L-amino-acid hydrolase
MSLTLEQLNAAGSEEALAWLDGIYEHSPWIAQAALAQRPFKTLAHLKRAMVEAVRAASHDEQLALLRAHPELAGKLAIAGQLTAESTSEQQRAGLQACSPQEFDTLQRLNLQYSKRFGWPFIVAVRGPRGLGLSRTQIIETLQRRVLHHPDFEFAECLRNVHRIAELRLNDKFGFAPMQGNEVWDWAEALARHSDPGFAEQGQLTVTYLTDAHRACAAQLQAWMHECGFDEVSLDAVGNVVGVYHGVDRQAKRLLTGSHYDTVRNAGKYDGRLGIFVPMACVKALHARGERLPFDLEVIAFAEEEGQRYKATFLGSSAVIGQFDGAWLGQADAEGVTMREAMERAGLDPHNIPAIARDASRYLGFVEVHIEQGPVLDALDLPLGIVTSINGSVRHLGTMRGMASHAGTTPMNTRRDAAAAVAELALYLERRAAAEPDLVGTMGVLQVPAGSINVVPGRCDFSLDVRATTDAVRDACVADVLAELDEIAARRGLSCTLDETVRAPAAPCDAAWRGRWERAVDTLGLPVHRLPSGAGHDAMKMHEAMPQAMLFVRGGNAGISHNPLETITADDAQLCVEAFMHLLGGLSDA